MKLTKLPIIAIGLAAIYGLASCSEKENHDDHDDHKEHAHGDTDGHEDHADHADHSDHDGDEDHADHDHEEIIAGPNGGRVITSIEPHAEFFVTADRNVQIAFVDDDMKAVPVADQSVTVIAGDRSNPTQLAFTKSGDVLISDKALPDGNDFPVVVQIKATSSAETVRERFNLNLNDCPTCSNKEYACTCEHGEGE